MIDPLEAILYHLLERSVSVAAVNLCPWDEQRAERVLAAARMRQYAPGLWEWTNGTRQWSDRIFAEISQDPADPGARSYGVARSDHPRRWRTG